MIAQMAQFSSLTGLEQINSTLKDISARLDRALASSPVTTTTAAQE
jgi:flagellar hook assembly protein FlgD